MGQTRHYDNVSLASHEYESMDKFREDINSQGITYLLARQHCWRPGCKGGGRQGCCKARH